MHRLCVSDCNQFTCVCVVGVVLDLNMVFGDIQSVPEIMRHSGVYEIVSKNYFL